MSDVTIVFTQKEYELLDEVLSLIEYQEETEPIYDLFRKIAKSGDVPIYKDREFQISDIKGFSVVLTNYS